MKRLLPIVLSMAVCLNAPADPLLPHDVVRQAIMSAQENKLQEFLTFVDVNAIATLKNNPMPPQQCVELLKNIDAKALVFQKYDVAPKVGEKLDLVITTPAPLTFVLLYTGSPDGEPRFKIIGVKRHE